MRHFLHGFLSKHYRSLLAAGAFSVTFGGCSPAPQVTPTTPQVTTTSEGNQSEVKSTESHSAISSDAKPPVVESPKSKTLTADDVAKLWLARSLDEVLLDLREKGLEGIKRAVAESTRAELDKLQAELKKEADLEKGGNPYLQLAYYLVPESVILRDKNKYEATAQLKKTLRRAMVTLRYSAAEKRCRIARGGFPSEILATEYLLPTDIVDLKTAREKIASPEWLKNLKVMELESKSGAPPMEVAFAKEFQEFETSGCTRIEVRALPTLNPNQEAWELSFLEVLPIELKYDPDFFHPELTGIDGKAPDAFFQYRVKLHQGAIERAKKKAAAP